MKLLPYRFPKMLKSFATLSLSLMLLANCSYSYYGREKPTTAAVDDGAKDYFTCLEYYIPRLDDGSSDASTIAGAVYASCERYFDRWQNLSISSKSLTPSQAREIYYRLMDSASSSMPSQIATSVLQYRKGRKFEVDTLPELKPYKAVWDY